jgi:uncharacterized protein HemX
MARTKKKEDGTKQAPSKAQSQPQNEGAEKRNARGWIGVVFVSLLVAVAIGGGGFWAQSEQRDAAEQADAAEQVVSDVYHVNNRQCAMSDAPIAEKDMGRFESRVVYDGPIERLQGKMLVFNQCCSMCIESFPKKWAAERDQIMAKFGLTDVD